MNDWVYSGVTRELHGVLVYIYILLLIITYDMPQMHTR